MAFPSKAYRVLYSVSQWEIEHDALASPEAESNGVSTVGRSSSLQPYIWQHYYFVSFNTTCKTYVKSKWSSLAMISSPPGFLQFSRIENILAVPIIQFTTSRFNYSMESSGAK
ncbi:uncharacterized protein MCYG_07376 [Microsporum canis CBS 113480]|uniref:Uncharacterized protein n=1 Tax=Arthroderma otae (strain ATCC MYA-4605 / CBS 113480) TaxID=554155 RepID=C5FYF9_ARTOC|nr:uncharacterized protein MCYG_07376 [Microsporum canis CBS 113480]EEQ34557.1 predicted protein [Microsporum canis CBS 113480]